MTELANLIKETAEKPTEQLESIIVEKTQELGSFTIALIYTVGHIFIASLCATFISISPSLMGVSMSRYYFMFITPVLLITSFTMKKAYVLSISFDHKEDANK